MIKLTKPQQKALSILKGSKGMYPSEFAHRMWPDSDAWKRSYNTGYGACFGKGMWLAAGSYLQRLRAKGWVCEDVTERTRARIYRLTRQGREVLDGFTS